MKGSTDCADNPRVGDLWHEMYSFICEVTNVDNITVRVRKRDGICTMSRQEFANWLRYSSIPDKTWAACERAPDEIEAAYNALAANW